MGCVQGVELGAIRSCEPHFPNRCGRVGAGRSISDADGNGDGGSDVEHVLRLARSKIVTLEVDDPQFVEDLAHLAAHSRKGGAAEVG